MQPRYPTNLRVQYSRTAFHTAIVIEPGDEFTPFVQVRFELAATPDGCLLTVVGDPLSDCRGVSEESALTGIPRAAEELEHELESHVVHGLGS